MRLLLVLLWAHLTPLALAQRLLLFAPDATNASTALPNVLLGTGRDTVCSCDKPGDPSNNGYTCEATTGKFRRHCRANQVCIRNDRWVFPFDDSTWDSICWKNDCNDGVKHAHEVTRTGNPHPSFCVCQHFESSGGCRDCMCPHPLPQGSPRGPGLLGSLPLHKYPLPVAAN